MPDADHSSSYTPADLAGAAVIPPVPAVSAEASRESGPAEGRSPDEADDGVLLAVHGWVRESPPWLLSAVLHFTALILLGVWLSGLSTEQPLALEARYAEELGEQLIEEELQLDAEPEFELETQAVTLETLPPVDDPLSTPALAEISPIGQLPTAKQPAKAIGVALSGREPGMRRVLLDAYGGTASTEAAVMAGLHWLARNQRSSGEWSLKGPYSHGSNVDNTEAATAMALLAFQGRGFTHRGDPAEEFTRVVQRGWKRLLQSQNDDGLFFQEGPEHHRFYTHAQCTIALCELYGMTRDDELRDPAQLAIDYLVKTQASRGGWRYSPGSGSDLSVTGWVVMALQSARMAGIEVPSITFDNVRAFLDAVAHDGGSQYAYMVREGPRLPMTAEGLLCRQYLGWRHDDPRLERGVSLLIDELPEWENGRNVYYWYYATQVCHHMEGDAWRQWNNVMRQVLPENQVKRGRERGSWNPRGDRHGNTAGRLYVTCLSIYSLEVYYRHLPIYRQGLLRGEL
ncbi:MAG: prenyltransferase/squalene oxidase repeat-containing protein [Planctomycetota bacterium]